MIVALCFFKAGTIKACLAAMLKNWSGPEVRTAEPGYRSVDCVGLSVRGRGRWEGFVTATMQTNRLTGTGEMCLTKTLLDRDLP